MKSLIVNWRTAVAITVMTWLCGTYCWAQSATAGHPIQYVIIAGETDSLQDKVNAQIRAQDTIAATAAFMIGEFSIMEGWESKYNSYLKTVDGYASALKAGTTLYSEGVKTLYWVNQVKKACAKNPQGIIATAALNRLYVEVAADIFKTYRLLGLCVAKGGSDNMMTGAERTQMLWMLDDTIHALNKKLQRLALSISYYNLVDVKKAYLYKIVRPDKKTLAYDALDRWQRCAELKP